MLNIRTRRWTDLNPSKRIRSQIRSENIRTVFISDYNHELGQFQDPQIGEGATNANVDMGEVFNANE